MVATKFFWGDNPIDDRVFGVALTYAAISFTIVLTQIVPDGGAPAIESGMALKAPVNKKTGVKTKLRRQRNVWDFGFEVDRFTPSVEKRLRRFQRQGNSL